MRLFVGADGRNVRWRRPGSRQREELPYEIGRLEGFRARRIGIDLYVAEGRNGYRRLLSEWVTFGQQKRERFVTDHAGIEAARGPALDPVGSSEAHVEIAGLDRMQR